MQTLREGQAEVQRGGRLPVRPAELLALVLVCMALAVGVALAVLPRDTPASRLSARALPVGLTRQLESSASSLQAAGKGWDQPADIAVVDGRWFLLDTGNDRILELNESGNVLQVIDERRDERLVLEQPMAIAGDGRYLYVASSGTSEAFILQPDGRVVREIRLEATPGDSAPPRPIGIAVAPGGDILVSDAANHRVLRYSPDGALVWTAGTGARSGGEDGFNTPGGLALDSDGNILVVDILNGRVVKLSPSGSFLGQYGRLGDTAGTLSRPKDVTVDPAGNVYVSDGLLAVVQVFDGDGAYRGFIGLKDTHDRGAGGVFKAVAGLTFEDGRLYVVDRFAGLFLMDPASSR